MKEKTSVIIPAKNEAEGLRSILPLLCEDHAFHEIIIVDDGSTDETVELCNKYPVTVISHKYTKGNGAAIKTGARAATGEVLVFMDADGQHSPADIAMLLEEMDKGYDMVVGARNRQAHAGLPRYIANAVYNDFASRVSGHRIADLTSGFRAVRADIFNEFLYMLPNGFSYPTTITMAMFRAGYNIAYTPINVADRVGRSHIRPMVDGMRFLLIIFRIGTLYSPLKFFVPASFLFFVTGVAYYAYTFYTMGRFTNMGTLLFIISILVFLIGLISEQLTVLLYSGTRGSRPRN